VLRAYGDGSLFGEPFGEGPPRVLWLHGWARRGADFAAAGQILAARGIGSVALDLPGFGASPPPPTAAGARGYAAAIADAVGELAGGPLVVVGHSLGGRVGVVLAATHPELVDGLVLSGAPLLRLGAAPRAPLGYRVVRRLAGWGLVPATRLEAARRRHGSADYRAASGVMRDVLVTMVAESYEDELARWRGPTTLVWGADDREVPPAVAERARELLGGPSSLRLLEGVGHLTPSEAPGALADAAAELVR
jgi:pimeloyl-ACP methyl ester carboxylesterase